MNTQRLLLLAASMAAACSSSSESASTTPPADAGADTAPAPPAPPPDDGVTPAASCAEHFANGQAKSGIYTLTIFGLPPVKAYCDMTTDGGGWTLAATRGKTPGTKWANGEAGIGHDVTDPNADADNILDVDWSKLDIRDVDYELDDYNERVEFRGLQADVAARARAALTKYVPLAQHPRCNFGAESHEPCGDTDPGIESSTGWVWDLSTNTACWWADSGGAGAAKCGDGTNAATKGRVWIR